MGRYFFPFTFPRKKETPKTQGFRGYLAEKEGFEPPEV